MASVQALQNDRLTPGKRMRQRPAVHQLQLAAQWHAVGDARSDQALSKLDADVKKEELGLSCAARLTPLTSKRLALIMPIKEPVQEFSIFIESALEKHTPYETQIFLPFI